VTEEVLFHAVLAQPPADRAAYLAAHCSDPALRGKVEELLAAHDRPAGPLDGPASTGPFEAALPGTLIGPYKLLQQIGQGGMGAVYMAEQTEPVRRMVAVKVIKPGMDSAQVVARFEAERQALALMDHQNIAKVFDAGTTPEGRPYFVMELIRGEPITKFCDDNHLTPQERLELFVPVCQAVQHAHQKGVIHRDLKPSNVLVTLYDGRPVPKVIDFGVAKALHQRLTDKTMFTEFGAVVGTLEYMAPEQAELSHLDVDTRSDIYSLGVMLYELLTGSTPLDRKRLRSAAYDEMLRIIREEEPPKPSTRLSESGEKLPSIAAQRRMEPAKLSKLVRGEIDWIVMKALEKDRSRRYETANGFARDLQRYLADETVEACPPSVGYRLRKFVRKHRTGISTAALFAFTLVLFAGLSVYFAIVSMTAEFKAVNERDRAVLAEQAARAAEAAEKAAKETALKREEETKAVLDFVESRVFAAARPKDQAGGLGYEVPLRDAIKVALPFVDTSFRDQPRTEARLRMSLGLSFMYLGDAKTAAEQFQSARAIYTKHLGPNHRDTLRCVNYLAQTYQDLGRSSDALKLREDSLARRTATLGRDHGDTFMGMHDLAKSYYALGRYADAVQLFEETLALQRTHLGSEHPDTLSTMSNLANTYHAVGRHADELKLNENALSIMKARFGPGHPDTLMRVGNVANSYYALGRSADAVQLYEETLAQMTAKLGPVHPYTLRTMGNLAAAYSKAGRQADALKLSEETLALMKVSLGPDHPDTLMCMNNVSAHYSALGRFADALKLQQETLALQKVKLGPTHPDTLMSMGNVAKSYCDLGRYAEALKAFQETRTLMRATLGPNHFKTVWCGIGEVLCLTHMDRGDEAVPIIDDCVRRVAGQTIDPRFVAALMDERFQHFVKTKDAAGCRQTAEMWEQLNRTDANSIYTAARYRAVAAAAVGLTGEPDAPRRADAEGDQAMIWLRRALAAGYRDIPHLLRDSALDSLRGRADYADLLWDLADMPAPRAGKGAKP
jgi:serine/threonine protein kinase/tetratricopeptide (TPR) repeat protein